jgi:zinc transport system substrate-binding protein
VRRLVASLAVLGVLAGCGGGGDDLASDGRPQVIAAFYPIYEAATRVGGDHMQVHNLTPAGAEPHDLELSSRQVDRIEDAAVVLYLGGGFQPALERVATRSKGVKVDLLPAAGTLLPPPAGDHGHHHDDDDELEADPHIWLDPTLHKAVVGRIAAALAEADPANRADYEANAAAYGRELDDLDAAFSQGLAQCDRRVFVTSHDAFGYLARRYNLTQEPIAGLEPDSEPSPRRMAELASKVRAEGITTIFYETLVSPRVAEALAREAGVRTAVLDPLEGLSQEDISAGKTYVSVMRENLTALRGALGCR